MRIDLNVEVVFGVGDTGQNGEGHDAVDEAARNGRIGEAGGQHGGGRAEWQSGCGRGQAVETGNGMDCIMGASPML